MKLRIDSAMIMISLDCGAKWNKLGVVNNISGETFEDSCVVVGTLWNGDGISYNSVLGERAMVRIIGKASRFDAERGIVYDTTTYNLSDCDIEMGDSVSIENVMKQEIAITSRSGDPRSLLPKFTIEDQNGAVISGWAV